MLRVVIVALFAVAATACGTVEAPRKPTIVNSHVTVEGAARMLAADGVAEKWKTAQRICVEAGHKAGTDSFLQCFKAHQAITLQATRTRAKALTDDVARRYGLCIDRTKFEISRCTEI